MLKLLLLLLFLNKKVHNLSITNEGDLVSVAVIFRHGDRPPINPYPNDPYGKAKYWPVPFGQLTNIGKMQHFELGQWLRNRYDGFLSSQYSPEDFYIRSTDVDRTLMSAQANLAGLFPPQTLQIWNKNLNWQPIPIHTTLKQDDNLLAMKMPCERYQYYLNSLLTSDEFMKINKENEELYDYLSRKSGSTITSIGGVHHIYSTLLIERIYNFTLPKWTKKVFPMKLKGLADFSFAIQCYKPELARLKIGPLLNDILDRFAKVIELKGPKFFMYSAHDVTIANILTALNVFEYHTPPYAATILFELRSLNGNFYVNILYKNTSVPQKIVLKDCQYYCPLEKFEKIVEPIRLNPEEWKAECDMKFYESSPFISLGNIILISCMCFLSVFSICLIVYIVCTKCRNRKPGYMSIPNEYRNCYF